MTFAKAWWCSITWTICRYRVYIVNPTKKYKKWNFVALWLVSVIILFTQNASSVYQLSEYAGLGAIGGCVGDVRHIWDDVILHNRSDVAEKVTGQPYFRFPTENSRRDKCALEQKEAGHWQQVNFGHSIWFLIQYTSKLMSALKHNYLTINWRDRTTRMNHRTRIIRQQQARLPKFLGNVNTDWQ